MAIPECPIWVPSCIDLYNNSGMEMDFKYVYICYLGIGGGQFVFIGYSFEFHLWGAQICFF